MSEVQAAKSARELQRQASGTANNLLLAVPKKGRLYDAIIVLLKGAGVQWIRVRHML
jgi:hypothetical protein